MIEREDEDSAPDARENEVFKNNNESLD